ncbi:hypothetical protein ACQ4PT_041239 [Festuca glaucescens]
MVRGCTHGSVPPRAPAAQQSVDGGASADRQPYMECTPLKDLSRNSYRWKVMVRVARIWEFRSSDQSTMFSLEFIAVDQQKSVMEGVVPGNRVDQFKDQLKEGSVYTIDKFDLYDPKKTYRSVDSPFRICFTMRTLLAEADLFDADGLMEASAQEPVIILFVGMTVGQYSGLLAFKSTSVTRWYVNVPIPEIAAVHERSKHLPYRIQLHDGSQGRTEPIVSSIAEISTFEPNDIMGERYKISVKITEVLSEDGWYYMSCTACWKKLTLEDGVYMCPNCSTVVPLPSHLQVQIVDPIIRASTALRQATADRTADKNDENYTVPQVLEQIETAGQASTPPPSTDLTPSKVASSVSAVDKVPSSSSGRGKRKNSGSTTSPKSKKTLQFPGND